MLRKLSAMFLIIMAIITMLSCNHNKIACPTYADSFPNKKKKKGDPQIPKVRKPKYSVLPPGYKGD